MKKDEIKPTLKNKKDRTALVDGLVSAGLFALGFGLWGLSMYWVVKATQAVPQPQFDAFACCANAAFADVVLGAIPVGVAGDKASTIMAEKTIRQKKEWENFLDQKICDEEVDLWGELF